MRSELVAVSAQSRQSMLGSCRFLLWMDCNIPALAVPSIGL